MCYAHLPTRAEFYDSEIIGLAFLTILKHILSSGHHARHLIKSIEQCPHEDIVYILSGTIRLWFECVAMHIRNQLTYNASRHTAPLRNIGGQYAQPAIPIDIDETFYDREKSRLFERTSNTDTALFNSIRFATEGARRSAALRRGMLDAGALSLVLVAFVSADYKLPGLIDVSRLRRTRATEVGSGRRENPDLARSRASPIPLNVICEEASTLTVLIHNPTFQQTWTDERFNTRRFLCSLLVDVLLGRREDIDGSYAWTNALFRKILD